MLSTEGLLDHTMVGFVYHENDFFISLEGNILCNNYIFLFPFFVLATCKTFTLTVLLVLVGTSAPKRRYSLLRPGGSGVKHPKGITSLAIALPGKP